MSSKQYQDRVNNVDKEIAKEEGTKASNEKKLSEKQSKIATIRSSINARTSPSILASKMREIERLEKDAIGISRTIAANGKKVAELRQKRNDAYIRLQRAEQHDRKNEQKKFSQLQILYDSIVDEASAQSRYSLPERMTVVDNDKAYDAFISHATEDKEDFVNELVRELKACGISVWYDSEQILWGQSLRASIDKGLQKSRFGIVVISPDYIADGKYWTKAELDGLFQLEDTIGSKLLPIWHNITKAEVLKFSPIIASRKALTTASMTASEIAQHFSGIATESMSEDYPNE